VLKDLLTGLDREQLQALLLQLAEREPAVIKVIEELVGASEPLSSKLTAFPTTASPRRTQIDAKAVRRQVRSILHSLDRMRSSEAYWHVSAVVNEVRRLLEQGWTLIQADDCRSALALLDAITDAYVSDWTNLDDSDGEASGFFRDLGPAWTEALLNADLSSTERQAWANKLETWQQEIDAYGVEEVFAPAHEAALLGWNAPPLQHVLQGTHNGNDPWYGEVPELTVARLHVLERRRRLQEYLHLAKVQGQHEAYVTMLVRLGRTQEAAAYGRAHLETTQQALTLARALYDRGEREQGLQIAEHGLLLQGPRASLAKWLREEAATAGERTRALTAAEVAFHEELSLANYLRVAEIAEEHWPERRENLLEYARHTKSYVPQGQVDVFLHEGLIDDAIAAVEPNATHTLVERVADAAMQSHPSWVIKVSRHQAEPFMDEGKAQYYRTAANWLAKARAAYRNMGREEEWRLYLDELLDRHRRKYKLVPLLEALRR
jgi:uncharacterized Zn finger protein